MFSEIEVLNLGVAQDEPGNVLWRLSQIRSGRHWKRALVVVGVNSLGKSPICDVASGIEAVSDRLQVISPGVIVVVLAILPYQPGLTPSLHRISPVNARLKEDALRKRFLFVDPGEAFTRACEGKASCPLFKDWLHPTDAGYEVIGDAVSRALRNASSSHN